MANKLRGQKSLFRGKVRAPVNLTLTPAHHEKLREAMKRLGLTRADLIALLIERHADTVTLDEPTDRDVARAGGRPRRGGDQL